MAYLRMHDFGHPSREEHARAEAKAASCEGKAAFDAKALAEKVLHRPSKHRQRHSAAQPYKCKFCGKWHIGAPKPR